MCPYQDSRKWKIRLHRNNSMFPKKYKEKKLTYFFLLFFRKKETITEEFFFFIFISPEKGEYSVEGSQSIKKKLSVNTYIPPEKKK